MMTLKSILKSIAATSTSISTGNAKRRRIDVSAASAINLGVGEVLAVKKCVRFELPHALPKAQGEWILIGVVDSDGFMDLGILSDVHHAFYSTDMGIIGTALISFSLASRSSCFHFSFLGVLNFVKYF